MAGTPKRLGVFDATLLVMGGVVGGGVFVTPSVVAGIAHQPALILAAWLAGGVIAITGALVYADLALRLPAAGGHYAYMREAFHPAVAFLFGWAALLVVQTGGIAASAVAFARYLNAAVPGGLPLSERTLAVLALAAITGVNCAGVRAGNLTQRFLMLLKIAAIAAIIACGVAVAAHGGARHEATTQPASGWLVFAALTPVMFTYGGWATASFATAALRDPQRDLPRAMVFGMVGVVILYLGINIAMLMALGAGGLASSGAPAATLVDVVTGNRGAGLLSAAVAVSTFGFLAMSLFAVPRLYQAMAADGLFLRPVAKTSPRTGVPTTAIVLQGGLAALAAATGTYESIMSYVIAVDFFWYGLAAVALMVLAKQLRAVALFFALACWGVVTATIVHDPRHALVGIAALGLGLPVYALWRRATVRPAAV
jgi:basic amino acid/polyamine antiporter, APA family